MIRQNWDNYYICLAHFISTRSHDPHTQHGCIITDQKHRILGSGYNGLPRKVDCFSVLNKRPEKYYWVLHAERNALHNCLQRPENGIAYVTGKPCIECLKAMYQEGIQTIWCSKLNEHGSHQQSTDEIEQQVFDQLITHINIDIQYITPHFYYFNKFTNQ